MSRHARKRARRPVLGLTRRASPRPSSRHARKRARRPVFGLILAAILAHAAISVPASHADGPGASGSAGQGAADGAPPTASGSAGQGAADGAPPTASDSAGQGAADGAPPPRSFGLPRRMGWSWDLEVDLGLCLIDREVDATLGMARLQVGALRADEPYYYSLGATAELGGAADRAVGGQVTVTHLYTGTWAHIGASWIPRDRAALASLAAGWSLFGVEWQRRLDDDQGDALLLHLRLPLGTTWFLLTHRPVAHTRP
jgi:hypothetical protein